MYNKNYKIYCLIKVNWTDKLYFICTEGNDIKSLLIASGLAGHKISQQSVYSQLRTGDQITAIQLTWEVWGKKERKKERMKERRKKRKKRGTWTVWCSSAQLLKLKYSHLSFTLKCRLSRPVVSLVSVVGVAPPSIESSHGSCLECCTLATSACSGPSSSMMAHCVFIHKDEVLSWVSLLEG